MKRSATILLQVVVSFIAVGVLAFLLWEPRIEGRNVHSTNFQIYFEDPFLAYVYVGSSPLFVGLYQAFKVLGYAGQNKLFSPAALSAVRTIKYCALSIIGFVAVSAIFIVFGDPDDRPAGVFMRLLVTLASIIVASTAAMIERYLQNALNKP